MEEKKLKQKFSELSSLLVEISNKDDMFSFVRDLCTIAEMEEFILRWEIAKALHSWSSYVNIQDDTWASSTTIARVAKYLKWRNWGYSRALTTGK